MPPLPRHMFTLALTSAVSAENTSSNLIDQTLAPWRSRRWFSCRPLLAFVSVQPDLWGQTLLWQMRGISCCHLTGVLFPLVVSWPSARLPKTEFGGSDQRQLFWFRKLGIMGRLIWSQTPGYKYRTDLIRDWAETCVWVESWISSARYTHLTEQCPTMFVRASASLPVCVSELCMCTSTWSDTHNDCVSSVTR